MSEARRIPSGPSRPSAASPSDDPSVELSARRTGMSFQRTRMSADRTLMSSVRTSLSLISFGFTIFTFFDAFASDRGAALPARRFGLALVALGILLLISGIGYELAFMRGLRAERAHMKAAGLIHAESAFPSSPTLVVAVLVLVFGLLAGAGMVFRSWPFG